MKCLRILLFIFSATPLFTYSMERQSARPTSYPKTTRHLQRPVNFLLLLIHATHVSHMETLINAAHMESNFQAIRAYAAILNERYKSTPPAPPASPAQPGISADTLPENNYCKPCNTKLSNYHNFLRHEQTRAHRATKRKYLLEKPSE